MPDPCVELDVPALSELDCQELDVLKWYFVNEPDALNERARERLSELLRREADQLHRFWDAVHAHEDELVDQLASRLTRPLVEELERKMGDAATAVTQEDAELWTVATRLSEPDVADDEALNEWYARPIADSLFAPPAPSPKVHLPARRHLRLVRTSPRRTRGRRRATTGRRARSPGRKDDPEPEPPLTVVPLGAFRADVDRWLGVA